MTSEQLSDEAYVWVWLPGATTPVVAGRLAVCDGQLTFNYGKSYLALPGAMTLYEPELPLQAGRLGLRKDLSMPGCIRAAAPDAWGRRVLDTCRQITNRQVPKGNMQHELGYLLNSGSERCGALDYQTSPTEYVPRITGSFSLEELLSACSNIEQGRPLPVRYQKALCTLSTIGGERPKVLALHDGKPCIAKFPASGDSFNLVKAEFIAMRLAALAGLQVAPVQLLTVADKEVLLVERFDRSQSSAGWQRHHYVNALTLLELSDQQAPYASYADLAELIRFRFTSAKTTLHELFGRLVINVLCGNTDDGAHNHAAFWDGHHLSLTPAFDICPQPRHGAATVQAMLIVDHDRRSRLATCLQAARHFQLSEPEALTLMEQQLHTIIKHWRAVCDEAALSESERAQLWGRVFVSPTIFEDLAGPAAGTLAALLAPAGKPRKAEQLSLL